MAFSDKFTTYVQRGIISFAVNLAHDVGVFDVLSNADEPLTSHQVANAKNLRERYVREILGCLTTASLVQLSSNAEGEITYYLKEEDKKEVQGIGHIAGWIGCIADAYAPIKACCSEDGPFGRPQQHMLTKFLDTMAMFDGDKAMTDVVNKVPGLQASLEKGIKVLECGSGSGRLMSILATKFPKSSFTISEYKDSLVAKMKETYGSVANMDVKTIDLFQMKDEPSSKYDWILTNDVIHDLPFPLVAMKNIRKLLDEESGIFTMIDRAASGDLASKVGDVEASALYSIGTFFCIPESCCQAEDSEAHGPNWNVTTVESLLKQADFDVEVFINEQPFGSATFVCRCIKLK